MSRLIEPRRNGWTAERRAVFIAMIEQGARPADAAAAAGPSASSVHRLYRRDPVFRAAWDLALDDHFLRTRKALKSRDRMSGDDAMGV